MDENGVLWSFGNNLFGKLGLIKNNKKQIYTNPREISLFTYIGIRNRCCIALCANKIFMDVVNSQSDIWYTPKILITFSNTTSSGSIIVLFNNTTQNLELINIKNNHNKKIFNNNIINYINLIIFKQIDMFIFFC